MPDHGSVHGNCRTSRDNQAFRDAAEWIQLRRFVWLLGAAYGRNVQLLSGHCDAAGHNLNDAYGLHIHHDGHSSPQIRPGASGFGAPGLDAGSCAVLHRLEEAAALADAFASGSERGWSEPAQRLRQRGIRCDFSSASYLDRDRNRCLGIAVAHHNLLAPVN